MIKEQRRQPGTQSIQPPSGTQAIMNRTGVRRPPRKTADLPQRGAVLHFTVSS
jgi:hypothetical protein